MTTDDGAASGGSAADDDASLAFALQMQEEFDREAMQALSHSSHRLVVGARIIWS